MEGKKYIILIPLTICIIICGGIKLKDYIIKFNENRFLIEQEELKEKLKIDTIEVQNCDKAKEMIYKELKIYPKDTYIDFRNPSMAVVQTKGKEYKIIFDTKEIEGEEEFYQPVKINKVVQVR